jgi:hypothetical protein
MNTEAGIFFSTGVKTTKTVNAIHFPEIQGVNNLRI